MAGQKMAALTMLKKSVVVALVVLFVETTSAALLRSQTNSTSNDVEISLRKLIGNVEPQVILRYQKDPPGFRKHPSYYSESYLRRARAYSDSERAELDDKWGKWEYVDSKAASRPGNELYDKFSHRDVPRSEFPENSWQKDLFHLSKFLPEAIKLTERAMEGILAEYGHGKDDIPGKTFEERSIVFRPKIGTSEKGGGGGTMDQKSFEGLKRRVLHAIMTEDRFTVAMGGHSAAAGHGNHFQQSYTLQIQRILEPVFARLGVKMSGRNFGMGGLGTLHNSIASGDIYGRDVDLLLWDSGMTEPEDSARGIMAIQALLGMDRAPLLWFERDKNDKVLGKINQLTGADYALYGNRGGALKDPLQSFDEINKTPWALQYHYCPTELKEYCKGLRYNGTCWIDRQNIEWEGMNISHTPIQNQNNAPGGRASWHPGNREHQLIARSFTFTILLALYEVLNAWYNTNDYALDDSEWHVSGYYEAIKNKVVENKESWDWCEGHGISAKFCAYGAKGRTENTPRNRPWATSLRSIMAGSEHPDIALGLNEYDPPELYNPILDPPIGEVDVLAIVENGADFRKNLARVKDSAEYMQGRNFSEIHGTGSKHNLEIKGGKGWSFSSEDESAGTDNCDGEHDSWCRRVGGCLMYGHNDRRLGLFFDGFSGWLIFNLPKVEHGLIIIGIHTWTFYPPSITKGWCSENNVEPCAGRSLSSSSDISTVVSSHRQLKPPVPKFCDEFIFEFAINGKKTTWDVEKFRSEAKHVQRVVELVTLLDEDNWQEQDVELAFRIRGCGRQKPLDLTHIYWI